METVTKPRLYIDIDGVLYGHYAGQWQLRPYIVTLTRWAEQFFDIYWLSFNSRREDVVKINYAPGQVLLNWFPMTKDDRGYLVPVSQEWHPKANNSEKLVGIHNTGGLQGDWILIEDTPPTLDQREILAHFGKEANWLVVPDTGGDVLLEVKMVLEEWLKTKKLIVPFEWATRNSEERDLCITAEWKGYGKSGRTE
jgi:hypothetical protein